VVREEEDGRLLAELRLGGLDQLAAECVDALVDLEELVAGAGRRNAPSRASREIVGNLPSPMSRRTRS
jgi:hypothetical protein